MNLFFKKCLAAFSLLILSASCYSTEDDEVFYVDSLGFSIKKPIDWHYFLPHGKPVLDDTVVLKDENLREAINSYATTPIVIISESENIEKLGNPFVRITARKSPGFVGSNPIILLKNTVDLVGKSFKGYRWVSGPSRISVSGIEGATATVEAEVEMAGHGVFSSIVTMILFMDGDILYLVGQNRPTDSAPEIKLAFNEILGSIRIKR